MFTVEGIGMWRELGRSLTVAARIGASDREADVRGVSARRLKADGSLACWGYNEYGQATPPNATFVQVSAGAT